MTVITTIATTAPDTTISHILNLGHQLGVFRDVDLALVDFIQRHTQLTPIVALAAALTSRQASQGHVCIDLHRLYNTPLKSLASDSWLAGNLLTAKSEFSQAIAKAWHGLSWQAWLRELQTSSAIDSSGSNNQASNNAAPLVLDTRHNQSLLYLHRHWVCEYRLVQFIDQRCGAKHSAPVAVSDPATIKAIISSLFPETAELDWQRIAVAIAAQQDFAIITGGPGTGKTTTVLKLLGLLQAQRLQEDLSPWHIRLAAPTGKAAARLNESIASSLQSVTLASGNGYDAEQLRAAIPTEVSTLHRLLGPLPQSRHFRHHTNNPLACDLVVVDEASMIDIEMMAALVQALSQQSRLILIGDKDQLASVEAGSILGDLCYQASEGNYLPETVDTIAQLTGNKIPKPFQSASGHPLSQAICMLRKSYRFQQGGGIHALAQLVNEGSWQNLEHIKNTDNQDPVARITAIVSQEQLAAHQENRTAQLNLFYEPEEFSQGFWQILLAGLAPYLQLIRDRATFSDQQSPEAQDQWALDVLKLHSDFQVLVATREGPQGLHNLNRLIEQQLQQAHFIQPSQTTWYPGRPIMITRNNHHAKLMNGDMGICLPYIHPQTGDRSLRVAFNDGKGGLRWVFPSRLHQLETAFAMTVHKSQGSEFTHTLLILPKYNSPMLSKELLYTGITRAKCCFSLVYSNAQVLRYTMTQRVERISGLANLFSTSRRSK